MFTCLQPEQGDEDAFPYLQLLPCPIFFPQQAQKKKYLTASCSLSVKLSDRLSHSIRKFSLRSMLSLSPSSLAFPPSLPLRLQITFDLTITPLPLKYSPNPVKVKMRSRNRPVGYVNTAVSLLVRRRGTGFPF